MNLHTWFANGLRANTTVLLAGILLAFGFAPFSFFPLAFLSLGALLLSWLNVSSRTAFLRGFVFGLGLFGLGISWVYISIHDYGHTDVWLAILLTMLFIMILSIVPAVTGYFFARFFPSRSSIQILGAFPALWVLFEWVKSWFFSGFPWLDVGYTQMQSPLREYAPYIGIYGLSFIVALGSACLVYAIQQSGAYRKRAIIGFIAIWVAAPLLGLWHFNRPAGDARQVSIIQANIAPMMKWDPTKLTNTLNTYQTLTEQHWQSDIIIWPEAAIPTLKRNAAPFLMQMRQAAKTHNSSIVLGIPTQQPIANTFHNSLIVIGDGQGHYNKRHLVPFGEFTPGKAYFTPIMRYFHLPISDFAPGGFNQSTPVASGIPFTPAICYESAFADLIRNIFKETHLIITLSDDMWFGQSWAVDQHLEMTQMRALESARYVIFANNNGSSAIINPQGHIVMRAPNDTETVLTGEITPMTGSTPSHLFGANLILLLAMVLIGFSLYKQSLRNKENSLK